MRQQDSDLEGRLKTWVNQHSLAELGAKASAWGGSAVGLIFGLPFFVGLLCSGNNVSPKVQLNAVFLYCFLALVPASTGNSAAMMAFVAPPSEEARWAKAPLPCYVASVCSLFFLVFSLQIYAWWPLTNLAARRDTVALSVLFIIMLALMFACIWLGRVLGCKAKNAPDSLLARYLFSCWTPPGWAVGLAPRNKVGK